MIKFSFSCTLLQEGEVRMHEFLVQFICSLYQPHKLI